MVVPPKHLFLQHYLKHIHLVQKNALILEKHRASLPVQLEEYAIIQRALVHDADKLTPPLLSGQLIFSELLYAKAHQLPHEHIDEETIRQTKLLHYEANPHHIQYHVKRGSLPSDLDICEMCCDCTAIAIANHEEDYTRYFRRVMLHQHPFFASRQADFLAILNLLRQNN